MVIRIPSILYPYEVGVKRKSGYRPPVRTVSGIRQNIEMPFRIRYRRSRQVLRGKRLEAGGRTMFEVASGVFAVLERRLASLTEVRVHLVGTNVPDINQRNVGFSR